jgi:hypothetical protein
LEVELDILGEVLDGLLKLPYIALLPLELLQDALHHIWLSFVQILLLIWLCSQLSFAHSPCTMTC